MKLFLAGEGPDELGEWSAPASQRPGAGIPGVLEALLRRIAPDGWEISGAVLWKNIRKFKIGDRRSPETRNVLGALQMASDEGCDALIFLRDRDRYEDREAAIEQGIEQAASHAPEVAVVGGVAIEELEAWLLAMKGERGSERHADAKSVLGERHGISRRINMVELIESCDLDRLPDDARSLGVWLGRAREVLVGGS